MVIRIESFENFIETLENEVPYRVNGPIVVNLVNNVSNPTKIWFYMFLVYLDSSCYNMNVNPKNDMLTRKKFSRKS